MIAKYAGKLKRFFLRGMIYLVVLLWCVTKLNNVEKHNPEFKNKMMMNLNYFGLNNKELTDFFEDPITLLVFSFFEVLAGTFGLFGSYYGNLSSAILFFITNCIYYNPLIPVYHISLFETRMEIFYNIGIFLSILMVLWYPYVDSSVKTDQKVVIESDEENEEEEVVTEAGKNNKKNN